MKQWAIKTPRGSIVKNTVSNTQRDAWKCATLKSKYLDDLYCNHSFYWYTKEAYDKGYRCIRVEIKEVG